MPVGYAAAHHAPRPRTPWAHDLRSWMVAQTVLAHVPRAGYSGPAMTSVHPSPAHVCVLGAGIVGLATAWELLQAGAQVTVVDRGPPGEGTSSANGAQLSYAYVQPLADPAIWAQLPRLLLARDSPLSLRLRFDPWQWAWGLRFLAACRGRVSRRTTVRLLQLAAESRAAFDAFRQGTGSDCDFSATGKLVLYTGDTAFAHAREQLALQQSLGVQQSAVTPGECAAIEPALAHYAPRISGAIYTPGECAIDCHALVQRLAALLRERGVHFITGQAVTRLQLHGGRVSGARLADGSVQTADAFVLALGTGTPALLRPLGLAVAWQVPVYPLKGYSITVPAGDGRAASPRVNVTDAARKVVFARLGQHLRIAGMAELAGEDWSIDPVRIASLQAAARDIFPQGGRYDQLTPWAGLRPATPLGEPVIGPIAGAPGNLCLNTGHGALGLTLAFGSARRVARLLTRARPASAAASAACSA